MKTRSPEQVNNDILSFYPEDNHIKQLIMSLKRAYVGARIIESMETGRCKKQKEALSLVDGEFRIANIAL